MISSNVINVYAQSSDSPFGKNGIFYNTFTDLTGLISSALIGLIIGATIAMFFWALFRGMMRSQGGTDVAKNKDTLLWGIGILFVMVSIWGIIIFAQDAIFGKDTKYLKENIKLPTIPNTSGYNSAGTNPNSAGNGNKNKPSPAIGGKLPDKPVGNVTRNVVDPGSGSNGGGPGGTASDSCSFSAVKAGSDARGERLTFCSADSRCLEVDHSCKGDITCTDENGESKTYHYCTWNNSQGLGTYEEEMAKKRAAEEAFTP